ncbi:hypothetical protein CBR_g16895 [Chara braunii]|uniref:Uncharacterized protein n=1 Tax=Chara braunii TaxID=69332 RepID=A0A388KU74_CHABU|nr:hypothetical protein CBR_g16895 [Chara braunii]|eukprot:GBG73552.1 hypothetical protein CBR_g16895 [Chara braunii]
MVEMCANKKLLTCRARRRRLLLPWGDLEEWLDDVPEPRRSGTLPPGSLTDAEIRRQARKMQRASTVRHPPSVESVFGRHAAHIELYDEEIEYEPPVDPQAADEMEAEAWTDPEELEQEGSDAPEGGEDGDVVDDEDSDDEYMLEERTPMERPCRGRSAAATVGQLMAQRVTLAFTPTAGAAGVDVGGLQGYGLDRLALERDTTRAREMGCVVEAVTAVRLAAESGHASCATGTVDGHDGDDDGTRVGLDDTFGDGIAWRRDDDVATRGTGATLLSRLGGLPMCDGTEEDRQLDVAHVALTDAVPHRFGVEDAVPDRTEEDMDPDGAVSTATAPVDAPTVTMSALEHHAARIDPVMGRSRHISERLWNVVPPFFVLPMSSSVPSGVSGNAAR